MPLSPKLVLLGKQGAGKGTQAARLSKHYGIPHISTGDVFRAAVRSGSDLGNEARQYMDAGELVPDDVVIAMVDERLEAEAQNGFLLDGFPRNVHQAEALEKLLPDGLDLVLDLAVPLEEARRRLASRRVCEDCGANFDRSAAAEDTCERCGGKLVPRHDDTEAAMARRLALYEEQTRPLTEWYGGCGKLVEVDATGSPDDVTARLIEAIDGRLGEQDAS